jgi:hypothetical protein
LPTFYIYGLHLEGDNEIRYVGSTKRNPTKERFYGHMNEWKVRGGPKNEWIKANADRVKVRVLQVVERDHRLAERVMIEKLHKDGHRLFNERLPRRLTAAERSKLAWDYYQKYAKE